MSSLAWATPRQTTLPPALASSTTDPWFMISSDCVAWGISGRPQAATVGTNWPMVCVVIDVVSSR